jgi:hypothetical protein
MSRYYITLSGIATTFLHEAKILDSTIWYAIMATSSQAKKIPPSAGALKAGKSGGGDPLEKSERIIYEHVGCAALEKEGQEGQEVQAARSQAG